MAQRTFVRFTGRVQGVGFRYTTLQIASRFALTGRIENRLDGAVEMVVEGEVDEIENFLTTALASYRFPIACDGYAIQRSETAPPRYLDLGVGPPV